MKRLALVLFFGCTLAVTGCADNAKKIIGKWEMSEDVNGKKFTTTYEFTADGKIKMENPLIDAFKNMPGAKFEMPEITYKVEGDKLTLSKKENGKEESKTHTIKELTDDKLVISDFETGKNEKKDATFTKKK